MDHRERTDCGGHGVALCVFFSEMPLDRAVKQDPKVMFVRNSAYEYVIPR